SGSSTTSRATWARSSAGSGCSPRSGATTSTRARTSSRCASAACGRSWGRRRRSRPSATRGTALQRPSRLELAWGAFAVANLVAMLSWPSWETIPFHFIWVSLTLLYGFRVWRVRPMLGVLGLVVVSTGVLILYDIHNGTQLWGEIAEVPLMSAMFLAMVWHARRRQSALREIEAQAEARAALLASQERFLHDASH